MMAQLISKMLRNFLAQHKSLVCVPFILALVAGVFTLFQGTQWTSKAVLEFPPLPSSLAFMQQMDAAAAMGGGGLAAQLTGGGDTLKRYIGILQSERVRQRLLTRPELSKALTAIIQKKTQRELLRALKDVVSFHAQPGQMIVVQTDLPGPSKVDMLLRHKSVKPTQEAAASLAQAYIDELQYYLDNVSASHERAERQYLQPQVDSSYRKLLQLQARQAALLQAGQGLSPKEEHPLLTASVGKILMDRAQAGVELAAAEHQMALSNAQLKQAPQQVLAGMQWTKDPEIDRVRALLTDAHMRYYVLVNTEDKSARHPQVRQELDTIRQLESKLGEVLLRPMSIGSKQMERSPVYDGLRQAHLEALIGETTAQAKLAALTQLETSTLSRLQGLSDRELEQIRLEGDYELESAMYKLLRTTLEQVKIREQSVADRFVVLDSPVPPDRKSGPSLSKNMALAFLLGIVLVILCLELERQLGPRVAASISGDR